MSGWLPPGTTDKDIDDAANGDPSRAVQCDECGKMFDPDEDEDCFVGWHRSYGDVCQCGECIQKARRDIGLPFSGSSPPDYEYEDRFEDKPDIPEEPE